MTSAATTEQEHAVRGVAGKPWRVGRSWLRSKSLQLAKIILALVCGAAAIWVLLNLGCTEHERITLGGAFVIGDRCK